MSNHTRAASAKLSEAELEEVFEAFFIAGSKYTLSYLGLSSKDGATLAIEQILPLALTQYPNRVIKRALETFPGSCRKALALKELSDLEAILEAALAGKEAGEE